MSSCFITVLNVRCSSDSQVEILGQHPALWNQLQRMGWASDRGIFNTEVTAEVWHVDGCVQREGKRKER